MLTKMKFHVFLSIVSSDFILKGENNLGRGEANIF